MLLYTLSSNFGLLVHLPPAHSLEFLWILPALVIPVALGCIYGVWAGLITGGLGYLLGSYVTIALRLNTTSSSPIAFFTLSSLPPHSYFLLGFLAIGSIAGLATFFTKGRYHSIKDILIAEAFSTLGMVSAFFIVFNGFWPHLYQNETVWIDFTHIALPNIVPVLVLLPIILFIRSVAGKGEKLLENRSSNQAVS